MAETFQLSVDDSDINVKSECQDIQFTHMNIKYIKEPTETDAATISDESKPIFGDLLQTIREHEIKNQPRKRPRRTRKRPTKKEQKPCGRSSQGGGYYIENEQLRISTRYKIRKDVFAKAFQLVQQCGGDIAVIYANERGDSITYTNTEDLWKLLVDNGLSLPDTFKGTAKRVEMVCGDSLEKIQERKVDIVKQKIKKNKRQKQYETSDIPPIPYTVHCDTSMNIIKLPTYKSDHKRNCKQSSSSMTKRDMLYDENGNTLQTYDDNFDHVSSVKEILPLNDASVKEYIESEVQKIGGDTMNCYIPMHSQTEFGDVLDLQCDVESHNHDCKRCISSFSTLSALREHMETHKKLKSNETNFKCHLCGSGGFETTQDFQKHVDGHSPLEGCSHQEIDEKENRFNSYGQQCSSDGTTAQLNNLDGDYEKTINVCNGNPNAEDIATTNTPEKQKNTSEKPKEEQLEQSTRSNSDTEMKLPSKRRTRRPRKSFQIENCDDCGKTIQNIKEKMVHRKVCSKHRTPTNCNICGELFCSPEDLSKHMNQIHKKVITLLCSACGKEFTNGTSLMRHEQTHLSSEPLPCDKCGKLFKNTRSLEKHVFSFHNDKMFPCSQCDKVFPTDSSRYHHRRKKHGAGQHKVFPCGVCGKEFTIITRLKLHSVVHTGDKPYKCSICGGAYTQPYYVKLHMKTVHGVDKLNK